MAARKIPTSEVSLAQWVFAQLTHNASYRQSIGVDDRIREGKRLRKGEYNAADRAFFGSYAPYLNIVEIKCSDFEAAFTDMNQNVWDKPWTLESSPNPDLPYKVKRSIAEQIIEDVGGIDAQNVTKEQLQALILHYKDVAMKYYSQQATTGAKRMELLIHDQLIEGGWTEAYEACIADMGAHPSVYMRGPTLRARSTLRWVEDEVVQVQEFKPVVDRLDPVMVFASPDSTSAQDGANIVHIDFVSEQELIAAREMDTFNKAAIDEVIRELNSEQSYAWWNWGSSSGSAALIAGAPWEMGNFMKGMDYNHKLPIIQYYGGALGKQLNEAGMAEKLNPTSYYECEIWVIGDQVIRSFINRTNGAARPIYSASFRKVGGSIHGKSIADLLAGVQDDINAFKREHMTNVEYSSKPITEFDITRFGADDLPDDLMAGDSIYTKPDPMFGKSSAVSMYNIPDNSAGILDALEFHYRKASDVSGIPSELGGGSDQPSVNRTASVYTAAASGSMKKLRKVDRNFGQGITAKLVKCLYTFNMLYSADPTIKYDVEVHVRGTQGIIKKEGMAQQTGLILQNVMLGIEAQLLEPDVYYILIRQWFDEMGFDPGDSIPNPQRDRMIQMIRGQLGAQAGPGGQTVAQPQQAPAPSGIPQLDGRSPQIANSQTPPQAGF